MLYDSSQAARQPRCGGEPGGGGGQPAGALHAVGLPLCSAGPEAGHPSKCATCPVGLHQSQPLAGVHPHPYPPAVSCEAHIPVCLPTYLPTYLLNYLPNYLHAFSQKFYPLIVRPPPTLFSYLPTYLLDLPGTDLPTLAPTSTPPEHPCMPSLGLFCHACFGNA